MVARGGRAAFELLPATRADEGRQGAFSPSLPILAGRLWWLLLQAQRRPAAGVPVCSAGWEILVAPSRWLDILVEPPNRGRAPRTGRPPLPPRGPTMNLACVF